MSKKKNKPKSAYLSVEYIDQILDEIIVATEKEKEHIRKVQRVIEKHVENIAGFALEYISIDDQNTWEYLSIGRKGEKIIADEKERKKDLSVLKKASNSVTASNNPVLKKELEREIKKMNRELAPPMVLDQIPIIGKIIKQMNPDLNDYYILISINNIFFDFGIYDQKEFLDYKIFNNSDIWERMKNYKDLLQ